jgi:hypothetical protein
LGISNKNEEKQRKMKDIKRTLGKYGGRATAAAAREQKHLRNTGVRSEHISSWSLYPRRYLG